MGQIQVEKMQVESRDSVSSHQLYTVMTADISWKPIT